MGKILPGLFGCGMFFVQFLQWWETNRTYTINTDKVPPPPPLSQVSTPMLLRIGEVFITKSYIY